ncbi:MAG TPA: VWA domain-containing protein [Puia sp.]|nr:VWA domain-containing protein [Puia sp.]
MLSVRFQNINYWWCLTAIPFLVVLFVFLLQWKKATIKKIGDAPLVAFLTRSYSPFNFLLKFIIVCTALITIIIGAMNFQTEGKTENIHRKGVDVMILLDVSKSMLAEDVKPSRLERAKQILTLLINKLENDRVGLILFAGRAYMQMPLTTDHSAAKMYIQNASPNAVPTQGTVIAEALDMANRAFNNKEQKYKSIVLISDGEDHDPDAEKTTRTLAENGVMINTIGIGSPEGAPIMDPVTNQLKKDADGQTIISKLNEPELKHIADLTNGIYLRLDNIDDALATLTQQLDSIEKKSLADTDFVNYESYFQWFLAASLVLLVIDFILPERKMNMA